MTAETEKTSLKQLIQGMTDSGIEVLQGIVKSASPLKIQMVNDEKLIIGPNITYIPRHLTDYKTEISGPNIQEYYYTGSGTESSTGSSTESSTWSSTESSTESSKESSTESSTESNTAPVAPPHVHALGRIQVTVHNALKAGEKVHVLSFNHGKQYFVLDRTEG